MAITVPPIYTPITDEEVSYTRPVSEETMLKIIQNQNFLNALSPVGCVRAIALNIPGVPLPNPLQFQFADGSEILSAGTSPIRSIPGFPAYTPAIAGNYIKSSVDFVNNNPGGSVSNDVTHNHGGDTGSALSAFLRISSGGTSHEAEEYHHHTISNDLGVWTLDLAHYKTGYYLKIN